MNTDYLDIVFEEAMAEDRNDIFSDYNDYIMDNADPSEVTICNGDMPNTTTDEREFLISGCTPTCWDAMYPSEEEA